VERIQEIAERHGLRVIYDAAHAFGTEVKGRGIGTYGDISMFSFHATKLFHTAEGGGLSYNDPNLKPRIDLLKNFGIKNEFEVIMPGINGKMNEIQAVIGQLVLDMVAAEWERRSKIRALYREELGNVPGISIVAVPEGIVDSHQYLAIRVDADAFGASRDTVYSHLRAHNVYARKYFYPLTSDYPCYRQLPTAHRNLLPEASRAGEQVLCLPYYGALPQETVQTICSLIRSLRDK
jgi:dTDP-4-amino-4,6-dideoxygalactose transaminase